MDDSVKPGIYRHYKGRDYEVLGVAVHTETEEAHVVYRALYGNYTLCIRPLNMFIEAVEQADYKGPRFRLMKVF